MKNKKQLKKYKVWVNEKCYYLSKEIEALDEKEAEEKSYHLELFGVNYNPISRT